MGADWMAGQVETAWRREGEPAEPGFRIGRHVVVLCGVLSLLLLAIAWATILNLDSLWRVHEAAGFALLPVAAVKLVPIGLRAGAYYLRALTAWIRRPSRTGRPITPPVLIARLTAPLLVLDVVLLLASGIVMWHTGDQRSGWSTVHNAGAIIGVGLVAIHLAFHLRSTLAVGVRRLAAPGERRMGGVVPPTVAVGALLAGVVLAVSTVPGASWNPGRGRFRGPELPPPVGAAVPSAPAAAPAAGSDTAPSTTAR